MALGCHGALQPSQWSSRCDLRSHMRAVGSTEVHRCARSACGTAGWHAGPIAACIVSARVTACTAADLRVRQPALRLTTPQATRLRASAAPAAPHQSVGEGSALLRARAGAPRASAIICLGEELAHPRQTGSRLTAQRPGSLRAAVQAPATTGRPSKLSLGTSETPGGRSLC